MIATVPAGEPASLSGLVLGAGVRLIVCDGLPEPPRGGWHVHEGDRLVRPPLARIRLELTTGGAREAVAFRSIVHGDGQAAALRMADSGGVTLALGAAPACEGAAETPIFDLTDGLGPAQRLRLARFVFATCGGLFRLGRDRRYLTQSRRLLHELVGQPGCLVPRCEIAGRYLLYEGRVAGRIGRRPGAWLLTRQGLQCAPSPPACDQEASGAGHGTLLHLLIERDGAGGTEALVLGQSGLAWRILALAQGHLPDALEWLAAPGEQRAGARRYVMEALAVLAAEHDHARAALREFRALLPAPRNRLALRATTLDAGVEVVIGCAAGVFVSGWLGDREGVAKAIRVERAGRGQSLAVRDLDRFAHPTADAVAAHGGSGLPSRRGFVLFAGERMAGPAEAPCEITLCLASGQRLQLAEGPTHHHAEAVQDVVLAAVPRPWLTPELVARCLEPVIRALAPRRQTVDKVIEIGRPSRSPHATVVIAVGDDPDHLRCRYGLLAGDPAMRSFELVHVLDRPEHAAGVCRLLEGLAAIYGIGSRLLILSGPGPAVAALDSAAAMATAPTIVFLGPGVLPERHGWLEPLLICLATRRECGIVGARIVHADDSLCHAGGGIDLSGPAGHIDVKLPLQGFPRDFESNWTARRTLVVPAGAFAVRRTLLEQVGGLPEGYLGADLAVAELCLQLHARGLEAWVLSVPTLVELTPAASVPGLDAARELDRRQLEERFGDRLRAVGTDDAAASADPTSAGGGGAALWRAA